MNPYTALLLGVLFAGLGGELFVRGVVGFSRWARVSPGIVAVTLAAFATSSPELAVAVSSALAGSPEIALGDALGSNVVNIALILGVAVSIASVRAPRDAVRREFLIALLTPLLLWLLLADGGLSRLDGALLLGAFLAWLRWEAREATWQRRAAPAPGDRDRAWSAVLAGVSGLALLVAAGRLIVLGAQGVAAAFGLDPFLIGATLVALGTSVPELATAVVSQLRGHQEVGLATLLGSNIFNCLFIVGTASSIHPIVAGWGEVAVAVLFGVAAVAASVPARNGVIARWRGTLLLVLYAAYVTVLMAGD
jgi:cation:H+ antiporter